MNLRCLALAVLLLAGAGCLKDGSSAVNEVGATVGHNPDSGLWTVGITISFKSQPASDTVKLLLAAGAVRESDLVYVLPKYDRRLKGQNQAIEASLREGATLTGWKAR